MTSSADKTLDELIDQLFRDPTWHAIRIFNGNYRTGSGSHLVAIARDESSAMVDQLDAAAAPSAKLRSILEHALKLKPPHAQPAEWDGAYTDDLADEWSDAQQKTAPVIDDFDDILG